MAHDNHPCKYHEGMEIRISDLRDRMVRVEKFLIAVLLVFASSSVVTVFKLESLPQKIVHYEQAVENGRKQ